MSNYTCFTRSSVLLLIATLCTLSNAASADTILEIDDETLTSYLATSKSNVQDVRPQVSHRGVNIDGSLRLGSTHRMAMAGNPFGEAWNRNQMLSSVRLDTGTSVINAIDIALPAEVPWVIGRSYNARQKDSGGSYFASSGYQGMNWFQSSQPELVYHSAVDWEDDVLYLVYGADRFLEFVRADDGGSPSGDTFRAVNGAAGVIKAEINASAPDLATYYDQNGTRMVFFSPNDVDIDEDVEGAIWKVIDPAGNVAYVGHATNSGTAITDGFNLSDGTIKKAFDSAGRQFDYTYTSGMLTTVTAKEGATEVAKVEYAYYVDADSHGEDDDLELVTVTTPLSDSAVESVRKTYYRYYEGTYHATTNPGYHHQLQYVIEPEGYRNHDWTQDSNLDDDPQSASENDLKAYASAHFAYDTQRRIVSAWFNGACGCSGASSGTHAFEYEGNGGYTDDAGYDTEWATRTIVQKPSVTYDGSAIESWVVQYFDEVGQPRARVLTDDDPDTATNEWPTLVTRNSDGQITVIYSPASVTSYTHSTASATVSSSAGLINTFIRETTGDLEGFVKERRSRKGTSGSAYLDGSTTYTSRGLVVGDFTVTRPLVDGRRVYTQAITSGTTGSHLTSVSYTYHSATNTDVLYLAPKKITTTSPAVSTGNNGSGSATSSSRYVRQDGSTAFSESPTGSFTYSLFSEGQVAKTIVDAQTNHATDFASGDDPNTDFGITETSTGERVITTYAYDDQGRRETTTQPDGRVLKSYVSKLADGRLVSLSYNDYDASPEKFYGPVSYAVSNHAGRPEAQATVSLTNNESTTAQTGHVDETESDLITAMDLGTVARLSTSVYDETGGVLEESRAYFDIPGSGSGTEGTNYDATTLGYDDQGRRVRSVPPHGTITRTNYDTLGRAVSQWIGTNDNDFDGGSASGTDNMVKISETVYDTGSAGGNSFVTKRTAYVEDSTTDKRETSYAHDLKGRVLLQTSPVAPHVFNKYDHMGRLVASGLFSSTASIDTSTDDPTTETTNRLGLSQSFYDEMGRVWKTQRHKIDQDDGSDDDNLQTLTWFDEAGRVIKVDGSQLAKTAYDRLGRATHRFTLASDNDTAYADADDVTGDIVLLEQQTTYESSDSNDVIMSAVISRHYDDYRAGETTGALDTNADGDELKYTASNLEGRIQITASWYDAFGRLTDTVRYGTYGGSDFDRDGLSVPARSDTALLAENEYNTDGSQKSMTDPMDRETRFAYDDAGRQTAVIRNYVDGTPSGDTDHYTRYTYQDGLQTELWVDLDGDDVQDSDDQVTAYEYGTTKGASAGDSKIETGHLLYKVIYPDVESGETEADHRVLYAYDAQSQRIWMKDQEANVIETDHDDGGRAEHTRVTTLDAAFDDAVLRITRVYDDLGRVSTVTQYDNATVGSGSVVDEVKYTYDDWGPVSRFQQDHNSAIGGTQLRDIDYTYEKATSGRNTIRRTTMDLPDGTTLTYDYQDSASEHDNEVSRVTVIKIEATPSDTAIARYDYNGVGQVVGIDDLEVDVMSKQFGTTSGSYPDLDRFDRVTSSRWTKDLATDVDFYHLDITYDRNSNITLVEDNVFAGFDVEYTIDGQDRLANAEEGTWNGSTITTTTREQIWTLDQLGNWDQVQLDLDGDGNYTDTDEYDDDRTHNDFNELIGRDTDDNGTDDHTLVYNKLGQLTDDDEHYEYEYDAFGRLRFVKDTDDQSVVAEYTYNGIGYRIGVHQDTEPDGDVDGDDPWLRNVYDDRWRIVGVYENSLAYWKELFVHHNAGADGIGGSSYIDTLILRERDTNSDGTLDERIYYCQNWRADVVTLIDSAGEQLEHPRYSPYGVPRAKPAGDVDGDDEVKAADVTQIDNWISTSTYKVKADVDLDGDVDTTDKTTVNGNLGDKLGWKTVSLASVGNESSYAGLRTSRISTRMLHAGRRIIDTELGRDAMRATSSSASSNPYEPLDEALEWQAIVPVGDDIRELRRRVRDYCDGVGVEIEVRLCPPGERGCGGAACATTSRDGDGKLIICICEVEPLHPCGDISRKTKLWEEYIHAWQYCDETRCLNGLDCSMPPELLEPDATPLGRALCREIGAKCHPYPDEPEEYCHDTVSCCSRLCTDYRFPLTTLLPWHYPAACASRCLDLWDACCDWVPPYVLE